MSFPKQGEKLALLFFREIGWKLTWANVPLSRELTGSFQSLDQIKGPTNNISN